MIKEGIEKEVVSRTFLCLDLAHQVVAASAGLLSGRPCPGSCLDTTKNCVFLILTRYFIHIVILLARF